MNLSNEKELVLLSAIGFYDDWHELTNNNIQLIVNIMDEYMRQYNEENPTINYIEEKLNVIGKEIKRHHIAYVLMRF